MATQMLGGLLPAVLALLSAPASCAAPAPQDPPAEAASTKREQFGSIYKDQVDGLINALCARTTTTGQIAGGDPVTTAKCLTVVGSCLVASVLL